MCYLIGVSSRSHRSIAIFQMRETVSDSTWDLKSLTFSLPNDVFARPVNDYIPKEKKDR